MKNIKNYLPLLALIVCVIAYAVDDCDVKDALVGLVAFIMIAYYGLVIFK